MTQSELNPGLMICQYRIERRLGAGGMGVVYLATDTQLGRPAAIKILKSGLTQDATRVRRFRQEARAASALNHPNILTIYEIGQAEEYAGRMHFIAAEFVDGQTLNEVIRSGRQKNGMTLGAALDLLIQVAGALATAHEAGIVHRDIKPENLMLRRDGIVKVLDFGLAKLTEQALQQPVEGFTHVTTLPGVVMGTINYMSPEQARGLEVDARSDLFSLGAVMYELLTGHAPFEGKTTADVLAALISGEPRQLTHFAVDLPVVLQQFVNRALAKLIADRYQTASEIGDDLKRLKEDLEFAARLNGHNASQDPVLGRIVGVAPDRPVKTTFETHLIADQQTAPVNAQGAKRHRHIKSITFALAVLALLIAIMAGAWHWFSLRGGAIDSVAVLPFANVGNAQQMEYLPDGLTESLINSLSQLPALRVSARTTVFSYKGREVDPRQVGKELQVRAVVMGRMVWQDEKLSIQVELIDTADGARLWGDEFRHTRANIVTVQDEIAREIAAKLQRRLSTNSQQQLAKRHSTDSRAYELYAQGRYLYLQYNRISQEKALDYFHQAIALDPHYALAYCGIADVYADFSSQYLPPSEAMPQARQAALKAVELDETLPEAHQSLALVKLWGDWDWAGAEREFKRALELNPSFTLSRIYYAEFLSNQKRFDEALREVSRAKEADPASILTMVREGNIYLLMRQYERAIGIFRTILELRPNSYGVQESLINAYSHMGLHQEAIAQLSQLRAHVPSPDLNWLSAYIYACAGQRNEALKLLQALKEHAEHEHVSALNFAHAYIGLGDNEQAIAWLRKGYAEHLDHMLHIGVDPICDPLRSDPRFAELLRGIGLAP